MDGLSQTLGWIVGLLHKLDIPFQAVGGLAANAYGARRPLADLDFYVPTTRLGEIATAVAPYLVRAPSHYRDESWDLEFMKLEYGGYEIEFAGAEGARFFDRLTGVWRDAGIDFDASVHRRVCDIAIPVIPVAQLVSYKRALDRDVDRQDIAELLIAESNRAE